MWGDDYAGACRLGADTGDPIAARALTGVLRVLNRDRRGFEEWSTITNGTANGRGPSSASKRFERPDGGAVVTRADETKRRPRLNGNRGAATRAFAPRPEYPSFARLSGALARTS